MGAEWVYRKLLDRPGKLSLELSAAKTRVILLDRDPPLGGSRFELLGFEFFWGEGLQGESLQKRQSDRFRDDFREFYRPSPIDLSYGGEEPTNAAPRPFGDIPNGIHSVGD